LPGPETWLHPNRHRKKHSERDAIGKRFTGPA
jgi:hypothetical protein